MQISANICKCPRQSAAARQSRARPADVTERWHNVQTQDDFRTSQVFNIFRHGSTFITQSKITLGKYQLYINLYKDGKVIYTNKIV